MSEISRQESGEATAESEHPESQKPAPLGDRDVDAPIFHRESAVHGALSSLGPRGWRRVLLTITLVLFFRAALRLLLHLLAHYRRQGIAYVDQDGLQIHERRSVFGRPLTSRQTLVATDQVAVVTLTRGIPGLAWGISVASLCLGTYFGAGLFLAGVRTPTLAPSLIGTGLLLIALGLLIDLFLLAFPQWRGDVHQPLSLKQRALRSCSLRFQLSSGQGWEISGVEPAQAARLVENLGAHSDLSTSS